VTAPVFAGPVDYAVFTFPLGASLHSGLLAVRERVSAGMIDVLDIDAVRRGDDDRGERMPLPEVLDVDHPDIQQLVAAQSFLLDDEDLTDIATELGASRYALVIVYEDRSLAPAAEAFALAGGLELFSGAMDIADLQTVVEKEDIS